MKWSPTTRIYLLPLSLFPTMVPQSQFQPSALGIQSECSLMELLVCGLGPFFLHNLLAGSTPILSVFLVTWPVEPFTKFFSSPRCPPAEASCNCFRMSDLRVIGMSCTLKGAIQCSHCWQSPRCAGLKPCTLARSGFGCPPLDHVQNRPNKSSVENHLLL